MGEGYRFPRGGRFPRPLPDLRPVVEGPLGGRGEGRFGAGAFFWDMKSSRFGVLSRATVPIPKVGPNSSTTTTNLQHAEHRLS